MNEPESIWDDDPKPPPTRAEFVAARRFLVGRHSLLGSEDQKREREARDVIDRWEAAYGPLPY